MLFRRYKPLHVSLVYFDFEQSKFPTIFCSLQCIKNIYTSPTSPHTGSSELLSQPNEVPLGFNSRTKTAVVNDNTMSPYHSSSSMNTLLEVIALTSRKKFMTMLTTKCYPRVFQVC